MTMRAVVHFNELSMVLLSFLKKIACQFLEGIVVVNIIVIIIVVLYVYLTFNFK